MILFLLIALSIPTALSAQALTLSLADIDSLICPPRDSLLLRLQTQLRFDTPLLRQRVHQTLVAYARLQALEQELKILERQLHNLRRIHALYLEKQRRSEISDLEVLQSESNVLNKEMSIVSQRYQLKETLLTILNLSNINILIPTKAPTK